MFPMAKNWISRKSISSLSTRILPKSFIIQSQTIRHETTTTTSSSSSTTTTSTIATSTQSEPSSSSSSQPIRDRAFIEYEREADRYRDPFVRVEDYDEINEPIDSRSIEDRQIQAARCMDCGTPFCQSFTGCPLNNLIPEWNDLVYKNEMKAALDRLHLTNNFPEFTGRVCPAPCEGACVAGVISSPVTIKNIEYSIVDYGFNNGFIKPRMVSLDKRNGINIAVIGSGPSGLACADILNQKGYTVDVYEREDKIGGLLTYGIPNMKLDKNTVQRRIDLLTQEGINFITNKEINDLTTDLNMSLNINNNNCNNTTTNNNSDSSSSDDTDLNKYDACVLAIGSTMPRDLPSNVKGRELNGIHFAMEFLTANQKHLFMSHENGTIHSRYDDSYFINAKDKNVVVIGGGDTGNDCIGTSMRHKCKSIINLELMNKPPNKRNIYINPWPEYPRTYWMDYGHEEVSSIFGYDPRKYSVTVKEFIGDDNGNVKGMKIVKVNIDDKRNIHIIPNTEEVIDCELVLLSMGFISPEKKLLDKLNLKFDGNARNNDYTTNINNIFTCGDGRRGQSLVVWAIAEGRGAANAVDQYFIKNGLIANAKQQ